MSAHDLQSRRRRRGSVMFIVMWAISIGAVVLASVQLFGFRHAMLGRQAVGRVQARWAARGGLEYTIAVMADHTLEPVPNDPFAMVRGMDRVARGDLEVGRRVIASWDIRHHSDGRDWLGPMDEHSKINLNAAVEEPMLLAALEDLTPDLRDALLDWIDEDDEERPLGAERHYYLSLSAPYEPRNAPVQSIGELELVAGFWPEHVRGEDWNLNNRLDTNENDGARTWPDDDPDDVLEPGWAGLLTTYSVHGVPTDSGLPRIDLGEAQAEELMERLELEQAQAEALIALGDNEDAGLEQLLTQYIRQTEREETARGRGSQRDGEQEQETPATQYSREQLRAIFAETTTGQRTIGKLNINTVSEALLRDLLIEREHLADEVVYLRGSRQEGITSMVDLVDIPAFREDTETLEFLARTMDTRSNVYSVSSRGRAWGSEVEVEIYAVVDRSTVPLRILEYRE